MRSTDSRNELRNSFSSLVHFRGLMALPALLLMSVTALNCTEEPSSNDTTSSSSSSSSSSSGEGGAGGAGGAGGNGGMAPQMVIGTFRVYDGVTTTPITGAPVTFGTQMQQTDVDGMAKINLMVDSPYEVIASPAQYLPVHFFGITGNIDFKSSRGFLSEMTVSQVLGALGETYDPTKAIITISAANPDFSSLAESFTADTTVTYGFAVVPDKSSAVGFSKGNASIAGEVAQVLLINVDPGPVPLTLMLQNGKTCTVYPSSKPQGSENVIAYAHEVSTASFICQ